MRRLRISALAALPLIGMGLTFPSLSTANHLFHTFDFGSSISVLANCNQSIYYEADTGFYVAHGFFDPTWFDLTAEEKRSWNRSTTNFRLLIDGIPQKSTKWTWVYPAGGLNGLKNKVFVTENHKGLAPGTYTFTGEWYADGFLAGGAFGDSVLVFTCDVAVTFE